MTDANQDVHSLQSCYRCGSTKHCSHLAHADYEGESGYAYQVLGCDDTAVRDWCLREFGAIPKLSWKTSIPATVQTQQSCTYLSTDFHPTRYRHIARPKYLTTSATGGASSHAATSSATATSNHHTKAGKASALLGRVFGTSNKGPKTNATVTDSVIGKCATCQKDVKASQAHLTLRPLVEGDTKTVRRKKGKKMYFDTAECQQQAIKSLGWEDKNAVAVEEDLVRAQFSRLGTFGVPGIQSESYVMNPAYAAQSDTLSAAYALPGSYDDGYWGEQGWEEQGESSARRYQDSWQ